MKVISNKGEGQSQCFMCAAQGKWNVMWHCMSYSIISSYKFYGGKSKPLCRECLEKISSAFNDPVEIVQEESND